MSRLRPERVSQRTALVIVRNTCTHDARVGRTAKTLIRLGYSVRVLAVVSTLERERAATIHGVDVVRLAPQSPFARVRGLLSRLTKAREEHAGSGPENPAAGGGGVAQSRVAPPARPLGALLRAHRFLTTIDYYRLGIGRLRGARPDLVVCNDYNTMWIGVAARMLTGSTVIYDSHELWPDRNGAREPRWWLLLAEALFVRAAHRTITTSPGYADVLARRYRVPRPTVVRNIPESVAPVEGDGHRAGAAPIAVYVGALVPGRGLEEAIASLPHAGDARLRIVGPGRADYSAGLRQLAARLGVEARVEILPPVPPADVGGMIRGGDVGLALIQPVCLSYSLSLPNKVFEYLAAGLPILGSDLPVIGEFLRREGVGCAVDPQAVQAIGMKISEMVDPARNRILRDAVAATATRLTWEREARILGDTFPHAANGLPATAPA